MSRHLLRLSFFLALAVLWGTNLRAANHFWVGLGGSDMDWSTAANWDVNTEPDSGDLALLGYAAPGIAFATGVVAQAGEQCGELRIGYGTPGQGLLLIRGGSLTAHGLLRVAYYGSGMVVQTNGSVTTTATLYLGEGGAGRYELAGGSLSAVNGVVGYSGAGTFIQAGGNFTMTGDLTVGGGGSSVYVLSNGTVQAGNVRIALSSSGSLTQFDGGLSASANLFVGNGSGYTGTFNLRGGSSTAATLRVGYGGGTGVLTQTGGVLRCQGWCFLGDEGGASVGMYNLQGGAFTMSGANRIIYVGYLGRWGTLNMGTAAGTGCVTTDTSNVGVNVGTNGTLCGWGPVNLNGYLYNSGQVIADGYGTDRTLDLGGLSSFYGNPVDNSSTNGWFARHHGKLVLPPVSVQFVPYWGERNGPDLVNSVGLNLSGASGLLYGALLAPDHSAVPFGIFPIAVWDFGGFSSYSAGTLVFRYDPTAIGSLDIGEADLRCFRHDGSSWRDVTGSINTTAKTLTTRSLSGGLTLFAVGRLPYGSVFMIQ